MRDRERGWCGTCDALTRHIEQADCWVCMTCQSENYEAPLDAPE